MKRNVEMYEGVLYLNIEEPEYDERIDSYFQTLRIYVKGKVRNVYVKLQDNDNIRNHLNWVDLRNVFPSEIKKLPVVVSILDDDIVEIRDGDHYLNLNIA